MFIFLGSIMHNLISFNQLNVPRNTGNDLITEYYECLIECDNDPNSRRICKEVLNDRET